MWSNFTPVWVLNCRTEQSLPKSDVTHDDPLLTGKIALAHLTAFPDYYTRLAEMKAEAKHYSPVMKNDTYAQMAGLAAHLSNKRKLILTRWRQATEEAPGVTIASSLPRVQFNDHIPGVLDAYNLYPLANPALETAVMSAARQAWSQLCWDGISDSSTFESSRGGRPRSRSGAGLVYSEQARSNPHSSVARDGP